MMKISSLTRRALLLYAMTTCTYAETIVLKNGDTLTGEIISRSGDSLVFLHPLLGEVTIAASAISTPADSEAPKSTAALAPETNPDKQTKATGNGLFGSDWLTDWKHQVQAGVSGSSGKSDNQKINIGYTANYEDPYKRWSHKTAYYKYKSEGDVSDHTLVASLTRDFLVPNDPRFYFLGGQFDYDEFKDFDYRLAVNGGIGYELYKSSTWRVLGRAGLGLNKTYGGIRKETVSEGLLQLESKWKINSQQTLDFSNTLHPNLSDGGEFRNITSLDWKLNLDKEYGIGLVVGLSNEYDSLNTESEKNDFKYTLSLSLEN